MITKARHLTGLTRPPSLNLIFAAGKPTQSASQPILLQQLKEMPGSGELLLGIVRLKRGSILPSNSIPPQIPSRKILAMASVDELSADDARLIVFSDAYDTHGPGEELNRIGTELKLSLAQQNELIKEWQTVAVKLNQIETASVNVAGHVLAEIHTPGCVTEDQSSGDIRPLSPERKGQRIARIIALATTSLAMLYVSVQIATHEKSLNQSAEVLASFSFDPLSWDVVVVTVSDEQADRLSRDLEQSAGMSDLQVLSLMENRQSEGESIDVVMASKETSEKLLGRLSDTPVESDTEWNPRMVGELNREELLRRFATSMKTPTQSDLFFREVIVVTSDEDNGIQVTSRPANESSGDALANRSDATQISGKPTSSGNLTPESESVLRQLQGNRQRPVLVVLKRRPAKTRDSQGSLQRPADGLAIYM